MKPSNFTDLMLFASDAMKNRDVGGLLELREHVLNWLVTPDELEACLEMLDAAVSLVEETTDLPY